MFYCVLFFLFFQIGLVSASFQEENALLCHTFQKELAPFFEKHVLQKRWTDDYVQKVAVCFVKLLDPDKNYFLSSEVDPYFSSKNIFSEAFKQDSLEPFWDIFLLKLSAMERAKMMRKALLPFLVVNQEADEISFRKRKNFAFDDDELLLRQAVLLLTYLPEKLSNTWEDRLLLSEQRISQEEQEWVEAKKGYTKSLAFFHALLLKAAVHALDDHSELLDENGAEELREALHTPSLQSEIIDTREGAILVLTLDSFYRNGRENSSEKDIRRAWQEACEKKAIRGVLFDLRKNRGGFLLEAVQVAGLFIKSGVIVVVEYADGSRRYYRDLDPNVLVDCPTVVLTSKSTASSAEIVAQALQEYGVGLVVGDERTYGKGSVQMQTVTDSTTNEVAYKVTVGECYGVSGKSPQKRGVEADILVPSYISLYDVGEQFVENGLPEPKTIEPSFCDRLLDIPSASRSWYRSYYLPFLEQPKTKWKKALPFLKKSSHDRMMKNSFWRAYEDGNRKILLRFVPKDESLESFFEREQKKEAIAILDEMIVLSEK